MVGATYWYVLHDHQPPFPCLVASRSLPLAEATNALNRWEEKSSLWQLGSQDFWASIEVSNDFPDLNPKQLRRTCAKLILNLEKCLEPALLPNDLIFCKTRIVPKQRFKTKK